MIKKSLLFLSLILLVFASFNAYRPVKTKADFDANNLMSDAAFDFANAMTPQTIDSFLNTFPNSCISSSTGFGAPDPTGYSPTNGFTYGGIVTAGQVIYDAAQAYGINPQVLLATMQKEQSLVTGGGGCSTLAYTGAMGYGCPDGGTTYNYSGVTLYNIHGTTISSVNGTCVNSAAKAGFSQQIIHAAWLLKFGEQRSEGNTGWAVIQGNWDNSDDPPTCYGGPMTQGNFKRCSSDQSTTFFDGWITIDGLATHMDDGATAALYWYTPHFSGNQNFDNIFTDWFGSTQTPATCTGTETQGNAVSRLYNPNTFEQFYTAYLCDVPFLQKLGFIYEGPVFPTVAPTDPSAVPVYRYYNPITHLHFWSTEDDTPDELAAAKTGYQEDAGIVFYVSANGTANTQPVSRLYNPKTFVHIWVTEPGPSGLAILSSAGYSDPEGPVFLAPN